MSTGELASAAKKHVRIAQELFTALAVSTGHAQWVPVLRALGVTTIEGGCTHLGLQLLMPTVAENSALAANSKKHVTDLLDTAVGVTSVLNATAVAEGTAGAFHDDADSDEYCQELLGVRTWLLAKRSLAQASIETAMLDGLGKKSVAFESIELEKDKEPASTGSGGAGKAPARRELDKLSTADSDSHYARAQASRIRHDGGPGHDS